VLIDGTPSAEDLYLAAGITARYGQGREAEQVDVTIMDKDGTERTIQVKPFGKDLPQEWYI
jgi:tRNA-specific 2-thiouridylase